MDVSRIASILSNVSAKNAETSKSLEEFEELLKQNPSSQYREDLLRSEVGEAISRRILGLLRCSASPETLHRAAACVARLAHGCDAARLHFARMGVVKILLPIIVKYRNAEKLSEEGDREWMRVLTCVTAALRKVTYLCEENHALFVSEGGVGICLRLCQMKHLMEDAYPPTTKARLKELTEGNIFTTAAMPLTSMEKSKLIKHFPQLETLGAAISSQYKMYLIDLTNNKKDSVSETLTKEDLVWPGDKGLLPSDPLWVMAKVTHVSGPTQIWVQFSPENVPKNVEQMNSALEALPPPPDEATPLDATPPLHVGNIYTVFKCGRWYRGWLLRTRGDDCLCFCLDVGHVIVVPRHHVMSLIDECKGIFPQVVPCVLVGVRAPPRNISLLENVSAILGNVGFEKEAYRKEVIAVGGIQFLMELCTMPHVGLKCQSIGALLNLVHSKDVCVHMRRLGAELTLLDVLLSAGHVAVLERAAGCILNMLQVDGRDMFAALQRCNGVLPIVEWCHNVSSEQLVSVAQLLLESINRFTSTADIVRVSAKKFGSSTTTPTMPDSHTIKPGSSTTTPSLPDVVNRINRRRPFILSKDSKPTSPQSTPKTTPNATPRTTPNTTPRITPNTTTSRTTPRTTPKNKSTPKTTPTGQAPIMRILCQDPDDDDHAHNICNDREVVTPPSPIKNASIRMGSVILMKDEAVDDCTDIASLSTKVLKRSLCGLANLSIPGNIYVGVDRCGRVRGLPLAKEQRNLLRLDIDSLVDCLTPCLTYDRYTVQYLNVVGVATSDKAVVHIKILPTHLRPLHVVRGSNGIKCYYHTDGSSNLIGLLEVREMLAAEECQKYRDQLQSLQKTLTLTSSL